MIRLTVRIPDDCFEHLCSFGRTAKDKFVRGYSPPGRRAWEGEPMPYAALARFFDNFQMPLLPPGIDEQSLLESMGSR